VLAGLLFLGACNAGDASDEALPANAQIMVRVTPGKPGAPSETVRAFWEGREASIEVERGAADEPSAPTKAKLPEAEFRKLWQIVAREKLRSFEPQKTEGQVFDFGERRMELDARQTTDTESIHHTVGWDAPLTNESRIEPLFKEMGRLAAQYVSGVELYYLPTPSGRR
jgi:hypothetical protein